MCGLKRRSSPRIAAGVRLRKDQGFEDLRGPVEHSPIGLVELRDPGGQRGDPSPTSLVQHASSPPGGADPLHAAVVRVGHPLQEPLGLEGLGHPRNGGHAHLLGLRQLADRQRAREHHDREGRQAGTAESRPPIGDAETTQEVDRGGVEPVRGSLCRIARGSSHGQRRMAFFDCDGVRLMLSRPEEEGVDAASSILYFAADDIADAHRTLEERGVAFRGEPHVVHRDDSHELWMTFFEDGEGNVHALAEEVPRG